MGQKITREARVEVACDHDNCRMSDVAYGQVISVAIGKLQDRGWAIYGDTAICPAHKGLHRKTTKELEHADENHGL